VSRQPKGKKFYPWTAAEVELVRKNYGKIPTREIADMLGRKVPMIHSKANELGLYIQGPRPYHKPLLQKLREVYQAQDEPLPAGTE